MIIQEELNATLDEPTNCLIVHRIEPSRLQVLALNLTDKLAQLADTNENVIYIRYEKSSGYNLFKFDGAKKQQREKQADQRKKNKKPKKVNWG